MEFRGRDQVFICSTACADFHLGSPAAEELRVARYREGTALLGKGDGLIVQVDLVSGLIMEMMP